MSFISTLDPKIQAYYDILSPSGVPAWLIEYIETPAMLRQHCISVTCGISYSKLFTEKNLPYTSLTHSIGVALIVWHFTRDKKQTLAGLFHDIATPAFKHCIDFLDHDYSEEESTEELTTEIINDSEEIMALLARDDIDVCEVDDYHIYPIADNDTPRLAADRLEYSLSNAAFAYGNLDLTKIKRFYRDLEIQQNEAGLPELGFRHKTIARDFVQLTSRLSVIYRGERTVFSMEFIAELLRRLNAAGLIHRSDLWRLTEDELIKIIENSAYAEPFKIWRESTKILSSEQEPKGKYYIHDIPAKVRYIDPLVKGQRASQLDPASAAAIKRNLAYRTPAYIYLDFML